MKILTQKEIVDLVMFTAREIIQQVEKDKTFPEHVPYSTIDMMLDKAMTYRIHQNIGEEQLERRQGYQKDYDSDKKTDSYGREQEPNTSPMTEKQEKAIFVITHEKINGKWTPNKKHDDLPKDWKEFTVDQASAFIEKHSNR